MNVSRKQPLLPCIQLLRFFAALGVMLSHVGFGDSYITNIAFSIGVNLFYCISAFLMMYTTQSGVPEKFVCKRLVRLIPLYWILTIATFFAAIFIPAFSDSSADIGSLIKSMFFIPYFRGGLKTSVVTRPIVGPAWTLTFDIWFMIVFAIAMKISHKWRGLISGIACFFLMMIGKIVNLNSAVINMLGKSFWLNFIFGITVFYIWKYMQNKVELKKKLYPILIAIAVLSFLTLYIGSKPLVLCTVLSFILLLSVLLVMEDKPVPSFFVTFGNMSYSFYLTHYYVILVIGLFIDFDTLSVSTIIGTVISFAISLVVAYISYLLIEKKLGDLLKNLILRNNK